MTGLLLAAELGRVLQKWRHTGYLPPRCEPHPIDGAPCRRDGCTGGHSTDGLPPWTDTEEINR